MKKMFAPLLALCLALSLVLPAFAANGCGDADTGCSLWTIAQVHEDDSGLDLDQYATYASDERNKRMKEAGWTEGKDHLDLYQNGEAWAGDLAADEENFTTVAASSTDTAVMADHGPYVRDEAGLLSEEQISALEEQAKTISNAQKCGVYILTVNDFAADGADTIRDFSKRYYLDNDLGWGDGRDGEMLVLSMADRDYWLLAYGDHSNAAFTDDNRSTIEDAFLDNFREDDWAGGFADYLTASEGLLTEAPSGGDATPFFNWKLLGICVIGSCIIALIVCLIFKAQMKSARIKRNASDYVDRGDIRIHAREDRFTHRTESRVRIHDDDHGGGGGVDSDGFSGGGGKF